MEAGAVSVMQAGAVSVMEVGASCCVMEGGSCVCDRHAWYTHQVMIKSLAYVINDLI